MKYLGELVGILIFSAFLMFIGYFLHYSISQQNKCEALGGAYIKGHCLKVETIKL